MREKTEYYLKRIRNLENDKLDTLMQVEKLRVEINILREAK